MHGCAVYKMVDAKSLPKTCQGLSVKMKYNKKLFLFLTAVKNRILEVI